MTGLTPEEIDFQLQNFEGKGFAVVRRLVETHAFPHDTEILAINWLARCEHEEKRLERASQAEMTAVASRAAAAAERAAKAAEEQARAADAQARTAKHALNTAIVATVIAAIALLVSVVVAFHIR